jgi:eukaryotic-like serine/threonine-protein kinase
MPFGRRVWGVGKVLLISGALLATYVAFFLISMRVAIRAGQVQVPNLAGLSIEAATLALQQLQLRPRIEETRRPDEKVPAGRVTQQDPPAGAEARPQRTVKVWISSGPHATAVPSLVGQSERTARMRLDQDGIQLTSVSEIASPDYPVDAVIAQDPPPPLLAPRLSVLVNRGPQPATYLMPNLMGLDAARVEPFLQDGGFRVTVVESQDSPGIPPGIIVRQQPPSGSPVPQDGAVTIEVSK